MNNWVKKAVIAGAALVLLAAGALIGAEMAKKPKSIIHVVTLYWKEGTTEAQRKAALDGVATMASKFPGIKNVWIKSIKVQGDAGGKRLESAFVMEFADAKAFAEYDNHPAHREWEKIYLQVRGESRTHDITNE